MRASGARLHQDSFGLGSRFLQQESQAQHAVPDGMIKVVSTLLHTTAFTGKAGAWNIALAKRYRAGIHVYKHVYLTPGAEWALQQRAF